MSILDWFGLRPKKDLIGTDVAIVHKISDSLDRLPPEHARFVGTFALLLARVAHADLNISDDEIHGMERLIVESGALSPGEAALVVEMTRVHQRLFGVTEGYLAAREFRANSTREDRVKLLDALFAVAAADGTVSVVEEQTIRQIVNELGLDQHEYLHALGKVRQHREVLRDK